MRICSVNGCENKHEGHGFCQKHYMRAKARGELPEQKTCSYDGCDKPQYAKGYCSGHYGKLKRNGNPEPSPVYTHKVCSVVGCEKRATRRGWCGMHYSRWKIEGDPGEAGKRQADVGAPAEFLKTAILFDRDECLTWPYGRHGAGYGVIANGVLVHRLVCEAVHGPSPEGKEQVRHLCGKGHEGCVSPQHLAWGDASENQEDRNRHGTANRGDRHGMSKLSKEEVLKIRSEWDNLVYGQKNKYCEEAAIRFGVNPSYIDSIGKRKTWTWLDD